MTDSKFCDDCDDCDEDDVKYQRGVKQKLLVGKLIINVFEDLEKKR